MELTPKEIASVNTGYWAVLHSIRLQTGTFTFKDHEYQIEPMCFTGRRKCVMKGTQGGFTEDEVLDSLHGMRYKILPQGVLYLFPTTDDVGEFSKSRFNPLIAANHEAIGKYVKMSRLPAKALTPHL
ncbi:MAG: phage terminase large subunit family protein [Planctomycetota bacterium]|jgi:phage terminase large subunit GpA-like protein